MTLDSLIESLQEAKEHGILGHSEVKIYDFYEKETYKINSVEYDNLNCIINF